MRLIKMIITAILLIAVVLVALANKEMVTVKLLPDVLAEQVQPFLPFEPTLTLPLFGAIICAILVGLLLGYLIEYLREGKHRSAKRSVEREKRAVEQELEALKKKTRTEEDEILELLET